MFNRVNTKDVNEAMVISGHNFDVDMVPLVLPDGSEVWDKRACVCRDTGQYLGTIGRQTHPLQPRDFYAMAKILVDATGGSINETLTIDRGSVIGIGFHLDMREYIKGDQVELNFLMLTSFNSRYAIMGRALSRRLACLNQLPSSTKLFNIKNTINNLPRLTTATTMLGYYKNEMGHFDSKMRMLTACPMSEPKQIEWFRGLFPKPKAESRSVARLDNVTAEFVDLVHGGMGSDIKGIRNTAYGALNALTEYCNHKRSTRVAEGKTEEEVRFESVCFGSADHMMQTGFNRLLDWAKLTKS